jgi:ProP effector
VILYPSRTTRPDQAPFILRDKVRPVRAMAMRAVLVECFPLTFMSLRATKYPLQHDIQEKVLAALAGMSSRDIRGAIFDYTHSPSYYAALIESAARIDLEGQPAGIVTAAQAARARASLRELRRKMRLQDQSRG